MASIFENARNDKQYRAATSLGLDEFEQLFNEFDKLYEPKKPNRLANQKEPVLGDKREALFFILHAMKVGPTMTNLGTYFDFSNYTAHSYLYRLLPYLKAALGEWGVLPSRIFGSREEMEKMFADCGPLLVDATEIPVQRPVDDEAQRAVYSGKKKRHTVKCIIIANKQREIVFIGFMVDGKMHDMKALAEAFEGMDFGNMELYVDLGFLGVRKYFGVGCLHIPFKKAKGQLEFTPEQKAHNRAVSMVRVAVENAIAGLKRYAILVNRSRQKKRDDIGENVHVCAGLWNFKIKLRKLRENKVNDAA